VHFDYNLLNLQAPGTESVAWERRILATAGRSGVAALASADSLEELRREAKATLAATTSEISRLVRRLRQMEPEASEPILDHLQRQVYRDFVRKFQRLQANLNPAPIGIDDLPQELRRKFISDRGRFLLQIHPAVDIWERDGARRFVGELREVDAGVTGTPIITYEVIALMERAYTQGTVYAIVLVSGFAFAMLRRLRETTLALLPLALGLLWTGGLMALFRLDLTMGNIFGLPLILGVAVEYGLNVVIRYGEGWHDASAPLIGRSTIMGVFVNGLSNIAGFGSLMLADHRGIFGLGLLITLGTAASLAAALVVLPVLLRLIRPRPAWTP
jgi:predicted RND superfamily exporter protein